MIHGGPGAAGEMTLVAQILAHNRGILEPLQTAESINGQVEELKTALEEYGKLPVTLVGFSWGAWLSLILAAQYPALVNKLILIGSGPFTEAGALPIQATRLARLSAQEQEEIKRLEARLADPAEKNINAVFARFGEIFSKADSFDPWPEAPGGVMLNGGIYNKVWPEAAALRKSGQLLALAQQVTCPVVALHGDHDPHPAEGVKKPLAGVLKDFKFHLLEHCGHKPWQEKQARDKFFVILRDELI
ncbi:MAG: alpha/beta hydrolase [bacterium]|nr:alpha/beta hydrolase [bacterium]